MTEIQKQFIDLVKHGVFGGEKSAEVISEEVVMLAAKHDLLHLIVLETAENYPAAIRSMKIEYALDRVKGALNKAGIPFVPMKGALIRYMYPHPWMRSSSDIDILVNAENLDDAVKTLTDIGGTAEKVRSQHDVLVSLSDVSVELHFKLDYFEDNLLGRPWDFAERHNGSEYRFTDAYFYYAFIAHMADHFLCGGTGVRAILDLQFVCRNHELLSGTGLEQFAIASENLSDSWFKGSDVAVNSCFESMVLEGGLFSDRKQWAEIGQVRNHGRIRNIWSRLFAPYDVLKDVYPALNERKYLLPFFEVKRIYDTIKRGMLKYHIDEIGYMNVDDGRAEEIREMLNELGLD